MATQIVELSGDEASLLRSLDKVIQKQVELERKLQSTGETGDAAGTAIEAALAKVERESAKTMHGMLADLKRLGPDGEAASAAVKEHLATVGGVGQKSMADIIKSMKEIDPKSAEIAKVVTEEFKAASQATG